ncbi:hypothetical protein HPP92_027532 [Vanilla planifolia]|uniref:Uncharacterized protein n=1 Tax=Vanilla planifolia TaxID=51239 RepID=A0A835P8Q1_VANPL|nr:hypothetical protein HPP92_027532 [Vanilla planifolia]
MFNRLFGKSKEQTNALATLDKLNETLEMLEKKEKVLMKKVAAEIEKAKEYTKSKNKKRERGMKNTLGVWLSLLMGDNIDKMEEVGHFSRGEERDGASAGNEGWVTMLVWEEMEWMRSWPGFSL